jgi:hypothetical protein
MNYHLRLAPPSHINEATRQFDELLVTTVRELIPYPLDEKAVKQLHLCLSKGGLGLRNTSTHHPAIFLSSLTFNSRLVSTLAQSTDLLSSRVKEMVNILTPMMPPQFFAQMNDNSEFPQKKLSGHIDDFEYKATRIRQ